MMAARTFAEGEIVWQADSARKEESGIYRFAEKLSRDFPNKDYDFYQYDDLHRFSLAEADLFWDACAEFCEVIWKDKPSQTYRDEHEGMRGRRWFPDARLNYSNNLLQRGEDDSTALYSYVEGKQGITTMTRKQLRYEVTRCATLLQSMRVGKGDIVFGVVANVPEAVIAALATAFLGAVWSSCSPDFGEDAICDRVELLDPKLIFFTTAYVYGQKRYDCLDTLKAVRRIYPGYVIAIAHFDDDEGHRDALGYRSVMKKFGRPRAGLEYTWVSFDDPLYILFTSGTTGVPKGIVHSVGGTLLQHLKEHRLHGDISNKDRLMFYTTSSWMMWHWQLSALATGCSIGLYEGAPHQPRTTNLLDVAARTNTTALGVSPRYLGLCAQHKSATLPALPTVRTIFATGAPLSSNHYRYVYTCIKDDVHLISISGGTDIISCFLLGNVLLPVRAGEIQVKGLGMAVEAWNSAGVSVIDEQGELVCTAPFVAMPCGFLHDYDGSSFQQAYFNFFPQQEVWRHGDFITITAHGSIRMHGRSDATLNPHGIRMGTAEIYRQLEQLDEISDAVVIDHRHGTDSSMVLFVVLVGTLQLDTALRQKIKQAIAAGLTPRHVPRTIVQVPDIPYTINGKKMELAVKQALAGAEILNRAVMANPQVIDHYVELGADFDH